MPRSLGVCIPNTRQRSSLWIPAFAGMTAEGKETERSVVAVAGFWRGLAALAVVCLALFAPEAHAQDATVSGVVTSEGQPVPLAAVRLLGTERGTAADASGQFSLAVEPGAFTLEVSSVGFQTTRRSGTAASGETLRLAIRLAPEAIRARDVVVTAARREQVLEDVAVPTTIVSGETIERDGSLRLSDVLESVPGIVLGADFGAGVQLQGLDPDYTLVLIDGEPVVGRTAGVLDLDRISVAGVERVEIVRGPSSSLYGSEALAGVINIVTRVPRENSVRLQARYGSFGTTSLTTELEGSVPLAETSRIGARLVLDGYGSDGYDLAPDEYGQTAPGFQDGTADLRVIGTFSDRTEMRLGGRLGIGDQTQSYLFEDAQGALDEIDQTEARTDWSARGSLRHSLSDWLVARGSAYATGYRLDTEVRRQANGELTYDDVFDQRLWRGEAQLDALWSAQHRTLAGAGATRDDLAGGRYGSASADGDPSATTLFGFVQHEWAPSRTLDVTASARLDSHSDFGSRLSPKLAALVRPGGPDGLWRLRASVGSGFKAPDPRQLYLSFTNAVGGYEIFGATRVAEGLDRLEQNGRLGQRYVDVSFLEAIAPETSLSFDAEVETTLARGVIGDGVRVTLGGFRTNVSGLIDVQPVAELASGGPVFSYVNLGRVRTEGVTADLSSALSPSLNVSVGYQWLRSRDRDVADEIAGGSVFERTESGRDVRLTLGDYANLFGRSTHTATARVVARPGAGLTLSAIGRVRSRYGQRDLDGNSIPNGDREFVPATALLDLTLGRDWRAGVSRAHHARGRPERVRHHAAGSRALARRAAPLGVGRDAPLTPRQRRAAPTRSARPLATPIFFNRGTAPEASHPPPLARRPHPPHHSDDP